ncbi:MAG: 2-keto-3-deoxy-L-rhamnonate aldolase RhmA [Verrucomicrobiales bacterium]|jgi:2-keto-3-deoxy-L-rhamnonate aldolase RhmA
MSGKILKEKLKAGKTVYGTLIAHLTDPSIVPKLPDDMLDFVIVTPEHTAYDLAEFLPLRHALQARGIACLARTHGRDESDVAKVCDSYDGVVVPYVEDFEEAKRLAAAAIYRPLKGKRLDKVLATGEWPSDKTRDYIAEKNADTVFIPMIESIPAVENLEGICSIPGVDALFVGPGDLTANMGIPKEYDHPDLIATIQKIIDIGAKHKIAAGSWFGTVMQAQRTIDQGARFVVYGNDGLLLQQAMGNVFPNLKPRG